MRSHRRHKTRRCRAAYRNGCRSKPFFMLCLSSLLAFGYSQQFCVDRPQPTYVGRCFQLGTFSVANQQFNECLDYEYESEDCPPDIQDAARTCTFDTIQSVCNFGGSYSVYFGTCDCFQTKIRGRVFDYFLQPTGETCVVCQNPDGLVNGDPHFTGFNGHKFDFHGRMGTVFNLLSESTTQVNALMDKPCNVSGRYSDMMWIVAVGVLVNKTFSLELSLRLQVIDTPVIRDRRAEGGYRMLLPDLSFIDVKLNGLPVSHLLHMGQSVATSTAGVLLYFPPATARHPGDETDGPLVVITTPLMKMTIYLETETAIHLDVNVNVVSRNVSELHGILGQTYSWQAHEQYSLEGSEDDYVVTDGIFGTQYKYRVFQA